MTLFSKRETSRKKEKRGLVCFALLCFALMCLYVVKFFNREAINDRFIEIDQEPFLAISISQVLVN